MTELEKANDTYIARNNEAPTSFVWHVNGADILQKVTVSRQTLGPTPYHSANRRPSNGKVFLESA